MARGFDDTKWRNYLLDNPQTVRLAWPLSLAVAIGIGVILLPVLSAPVVVLAGAGAFLALNLVAGLSNLINDWFFRAETPNKDGREQSLDDKLFRSAIPVFVFALIASVGLAALLAAFSTLAPVIVFAVFIGSFVGIIALESLYSAVHMLFDSDALDHLRVAKADANTTEMQEREPLLSEDGANPSAENNGEDADGAKSLKVKTSDRSTVSNISWFKRLFPHGVAPTAAFPIALVLGFCVTALLLSFNLATMGVAIGLGVGIFAGLSVLTLALSGAWRHLLVHYKLNIIEKAIPDQLSGPGDRLKQLASAYGRITVFALAVGIVIGALVFHFTALGLPLVMAAAMGSVALVGLFNAAAHFYLFKQNKHQDDRNPTLGVYDPERFFAQMQGVLSLMLAVALAGLTFGFGLLPITSAMGLAVGVAALMTLVIPFVCKIINTKVFSDKADFNPKLFIPVSAVVAGLLTGLVLGLMHFAILPTILLAVTAFAAQLIIPGAIALTRQIVSDYQPPEISNNPLTDPNPALKKSAEKSPPAPATDEQITNYLDCGTKGLQWNDSVLVGFYISKELYRDGVNIEIHNNLKMSKEFAAKLSRYERSIVEFAKQDAKFNATVYEDISTVESKVSYLLAYAKNYEQELAKQQQSARQQSAP